MSSSRSWLSWSVAILTLIAYAAIPTILVLGLWRTSALSDLVSIPLFALAAATFLACVLALLAMGRGGLRERTAIIRLPRTAAGRWALRITVLFYPAVVLFTGNTLFDLVRALALPERAFDALFPMLEAAGRWAIVAIAAGALVLGLAALMSRRGRAFVLGLTLLPALLVALFVIGEMMGH